MDQVDTIQTQQMNNIFMALKKFEIFFILFLKKLLLSLTVLHFSECYGTGLIFIEIFLN